MKFRDISITTKILIPSSISLVLVILTAFWIYYVGNEVRALAQLAKVDGLILTNAAHQMDMDVIEMQQWLTDISATRSLDGLDDGFIQAEKSYQSLLSGLSIFKNQYKKKHDEQGLAELEQIRLQLDEYYLLGKKMANAYIEHGPSQGNKSMKVFDEQAEILSASLKPFVGRHFDIIVNELEDVSGTVLFLMKGELIIFMMIGFSIITGAFLMLRMVTLHVRQSQSVVEKLARGELIGRLEMETSKDEMGRLMASLGDLYKHLQVIVGEVNNSSDQIRTTSYDISMDNENLSNLMSKQTSALHETSESMSRVTESVHENAENAQRASALANEATEVAREGALAITNTIGSMGQVDASSKKISEITAVIDSIAFQTNLLALNASVEAARAGDEGRGFAVVANEVRSLAQRSAASAKEIKSLIEESVKRVDAFSKQVDASGEALAEIVGAVREVSEVVDKMAQANHEQSISVNEVNRSISEMTSMIEGNSGVAIEAVNYSVKLKEQADHLSNLMNFFKIER